MVELSLSTMWSKGNYSQMEKFVQDARDWGFSQIELNSVLTSRKLEELLKVKGVKISSVHALCPNVLLAENIWASSLSLSSLDRDEREKAVEFTKTTIELASRIGAKAVILHAGHVPVNVKLEEELRKLYEEGLNSSREYSKIKEKLIEERTNSAGPHLEAAIESLDQLSTFASEKEIMLGLENRVSFHEIPNLKEMKILLDEFAGKPVGYWHDIGHAEVQSRLGFTPPPHRDWFRQLGRKMIGCHLHDVLEVSDHRAPGTGDMDWGFIAENLPKDIIKTCEIGEWNNRPDLRRAVPFLSERAFSKAGCSYPMWNFRENWL